MPLNTLHSSKAPDFQQIVNNGFLSSFRNKLINSDFDLWQRGTSFTPTNGSYSADRWKYFFDGTGATRFIARGTLTVGQNVVPGNPQYYLAVNQSVAGSGGTYNQIGQFIEGVRTLAGRQVTLTLWMSATSITLPSIYIVQGFGTGGSPSGAVTTTVASNISVGASFTKFTYTFTIPSISGKTLGSNGDDSLQVYVNLPLNSTFTWNLAHVSLVEGDATAEADPFSPRHIGLETALCQRYYEKSFDLNVAPAQNTGSTNGVVSFIGQVLNQACEVPVYFKVPKRAIPSVTAYSPNAANSSWSLNGTTPNVALPYLGVSSMVLRATGSITAGNTYSIHWTADAEL